MWITVHLLDPEHQPQGTHSQTTIHQTPSDNPPSASHSLGSLRRQQ